MFVCPECGAHQAEPGHCGADGVVVVAVGEDMLLGQTIGAYRVARLLGIGGMGRVYKGVHPSIGSRVAIKVLSRECSDRRDLVERFFSEARAVNLIRHETIVNVLDLNVLPDGRPFIIMEYLDGAPLASLVETANARGLPLPLGGVARLAGEVLEALGAAHAKGIVHRDLKPDNIFVAPSGRPKVLDFGIAKLNDVQHTATATGSLLGTPHYMAPEQASGRPVDHRADLYAMGVILYECTTGHKPFVADSLFELLRKHVEVPPQPPRMLRPDLPPALESVILTALAKAPDQRFGNAAAMSAALHHASGGLPPEAWQPLTPTLTGSGAAGPSSWAPTRPESWGSRPPQGGPQTPVPTPIGHTGALGPNVSQHPSTVSSGQVGRTQASGSRGMVWAVLALVLVGGGIAVGVVAGGSGGAKTGGDPQTAGGSANAGTLATAAGAPTAATGAPANTAPTVATDPTTTNPTNAGSSPPVKIAGAPPATVPSHPHPPIAMPPPSTQPDIPTMPIGPPPPPPPTTPSGGWVTRHHIDAPAGFDPAHVDTQAFVAWAVAAARREIPDAQLIRIDADGVGPDGVANLTYATLASKHGDIDVRFISKAHMAGDPNVPIGVARDWKCEFRVEAEPDGIMVSPIDGWDCSKEHVLPLPRCSFSGVWKRALSHKAPQNAVSELGYRSDFDGHATWYFNIGFGMDKAFSDMFPDNC